MIRPPQPGQCLRGGSGHLEERARKAWEYYVEEPLVKNCVNSWRTFAVGDEIKIAGDDDKLKEEATEAAYRLNLSQFVKDMILQLLVKGDAVGFKRYAKSGRDIEELVCVNRPKPTAPLRRDQADFT